METGMLIARCTLSILYFTIWIFILKSQYRTIWDSFKGEDKILQTSEFVVLVGIIGYILMIPADAFWSIEASEKLWWGIDLIVTVALGVSAYMKSKEK